MTPRHLLLAYPWVIATAPILSMVATNSDAQMPLTGILAALAISWSVTSVAYAASFAWLHNPWRAAPLLWA